MLVLVCCLFGLVWIDWLHVCLFGCFRCFVRLFGSQVVCLAGSVDSVFVCLFVCLFVVGLVSFV